MVKRGIIFVVVENDLLSGVTSDERAAVVSVDGGARVDDGISDWREYVGMFSESSLGSLVVPFSRGWSNSQVKKDGYQGRCQLQHRSQF